MTGIFRRKLFLLNQEKKHYSKEIESRDLKAIVHLANFCDNLGFYDHALHYFNLVIEYYKNDKTIIVDSLLSIGFIYLKKLFDKTTAEKYFIDVQKIDAKNVTAIETLAHMDTILLTATNELCKKFSRW
jgi:tetratricopeptide (TPR) repeat protein